MTNGPRMRELYCIPLATTEVGIHVCQMVDITKRYVAHWLLAQTRRAKSCTYSVPHGEVQEKDGARVRRPPRPHGGVSRDDERVCNSWLVNKPKNERDYADGNTALGGGGVRSARPRDISRTGNPSGAPFLLSAGPGGQSATLRTYAQIMAHMYAKPNVEMLRIPLRKCTGGVARRRLADARLARKPYVRCTVDIYIPKSAPSTSPRDAYRTRISRIREKNSVIGIHVCRGGQRDISI
jgi:hypothetical protein